ncbi:MAG: YceI family protein [Salibacteraceae bacterium]
MILLAATAIFASCGQSSSEEKSAAKASPEQEVTEKVCTYSYDHSASEFVWTAYKYNQKTGVKGTFDVISVSGLDGTGSVTDVFSEGEITIATGSVNSGDPTRDPKIVEHFFGQLENGETMNIKVSEVTDNTMTFDITMNGQTKMITSNYTLEGNELEARAEIDVNTWGAQNGIDMLNEVCEDLHKGADGESVLWPDVSLLITTTLIENCN